MLYASSECRVARLVLAVQGTDFKQQYENNGKKKQSLIVDKGWSPVVAAGQRID